MSILIQIPVLSLGNQKKAQKFKVFEESVELLKANTTEDKINEAIDVIQATIGYLRMFPSNDIYECSKKHNEKIIGRNWELLGYIDLIQNF